MIRKPQMLGIKNNKALQQYKSCFLDRWVEGWHVHLTPKKLVTEALRGIFLYTIRLHPMP